MTIKNHDFLFDTFCSDPYKHRSNLKLLSSALKDYATQGRSIAEFEKDYACKVIMDDYGNIKDVTYDKDSTVTMMKLKYD